METTKQERTSAGSVSSLRLGDFDIRACSHYEKLTKDAILGAWK